MTLSERFEIREFPPLVFPFHVGRGNINGTGYGFTTFFKLLSITDKAVFCIKQIKTINTTKYLLGA